MRRIHFQTPLAISIPAFIVLALGLAACAPDLKKNNRDVDANGNSLRPIALFDLQNQQNLPWPNLLAQITPDTSGIAAIGRINIANPKNDPLITQVNQLSGFTPLPVITVDFSLPVSLGSVRPGENFVIIGLNPKDAKDVDNLSDAVETTFDTANGKLRIYPQRPLQPGFEYVVVLTKSIHGDNGFPIQEDINFRLMKFDQPLLDTKTGEITSGLLLSNGTTVAQAAQLEAVRGLYQKTIFNNATLNGIVQADLARDSGITASDLTPQQVLDHYAIAFAFVTATFPGGDPTAMLDQAMTKNTASPLSGNFSLAVSYPAAAFFAANAPDVPNSHLSFVAFGGITSLDFRSTKGLWPADATGLTGQVSAVPVIITYPLQATAAPVPVVIFQHGLGSCKNQAVLAVADSFAQAGFAVVGIDIIEHGDRAVTNADTTNDKKEAGTCDKTVGGKLIATGEGFLRFDDLTITRDSMRQTVVDLASLAKAANGGAFTTLQPAGDFVTGAVTFAGIDLGASLGADFIAEQNNVKTGVLNAGGAWLSRMFTESQVIGPPLLKRLADASGLGPVTSPAFQDYLTKLVPLIQGLVDPAEPAYYIAKDVNGKNISTAHSLLLQQVVADPVVPDASTAYLGNLAGLKVISKEVSVAGRSGPFPFPAWTQFNVPSHAVLLTPDNPASTKPDQDFLATTAAMREQMLTYLGSFLQSAGALLQVVIKP